MHTKLALVAISTFALAACGESGVVEDPSDPDQIAAATANLPTPQAGEYSVTGELAEFELTGVGEEEAEFARGMFEMMFAQEQTQCITQEQAEAGYQEFLQEMNNDTEGCEYSSYEVSGNTIDATMQCDDGAGNTGSIDFDGTVTETTQDLTMAMDMVAEGQGIKMTVNMNLDRVGDCAS